MPVNRNLDCDAFKIDAAARSCVALRVSDPTEHHVMSDTSKRATLESILPKLQKLLPHLGNANANEAEVARQKINGLLASVKLDWNDLATLLADKQEPLRLFAKEPDILVDLALSGAELFCSPDEKPFADVIVHEYRNTWPLNSDQFNDWLTYRFFTEWRRAPGPGPLKQAIRTLGAHAKFGSGLRHDVYLRVAELDGKIYVDIGDPTWSVVEIDKSRWRMIDNSPVRFRRTQGMQALPLPERGGSIEQLRSLVNLSDDGFVLFVACLLDALCPGRPHPLLYLAGDEGSAKSTAAKIARSLIDPNSIPLRNLPSNVRELSVGVNNAYMLAFDNVSEIQANISDALCQVATGSGFGTRKLFTNTAEVLIDGYRSVVISGLGNAITRSDLADRAVIINMSRIAPERLRSEREIWSQFESQRPQIFGALLDCMAHGLRHLPQTQLARAPRMIDFASWGVATAAFPQDVFLAALERTATDATEAVIENDPVAVAVSVFMVARGSWVGTAAQLLNELTKRDHSEAVPSRSRAWPREVSAFGKRLRAAKVALGKIGIDVQIGRASDRRRTRSIRLSAVRPPQAGETDASDRSDRADGSRTVAKGDLTPSKH
jgi:hypothetical protein